MKSSMKYKTCDKCGANLDHGEKCDCEEREIVQKLLDGLIGSSEEQKILDGLIHSSKEAASKLERKN